MSSVNVPGSSMNYATDTMSPECPLTAMHGPHSKGSDSPAANSMDPSCRMGLLRSHGDFSLAYTTAVHDSLRYFGDETGYIAYKVKRKKYVLALGDPVAAPKNRERLIERFINQHRHTAFCQTSPSTAKILDRHGFYNNEMGVDSILYLPEYDFRGKHKKWLRTAEAWTQRRGFTAREETTDSVGLDQIESVSLAWRSSRIVKQREIRFLTRPLMITDEPGTRRFYFFDPEDRMLAFVFFDPLYREGKLIGFAASSKRRHPDAPVYAEQAIMKHAIEVFKNEGLEELRFGLSPLAWIEDQDFKSSWLLGKMFRSGFSSRWVNRRIYNVQGHAQYKRRYRGREEKVYYATRTPNNLMQLAALIKACKIF